MFHKEVTSKLKQICTYPSGLAHGIENKWPWVQNLGKQICTLDTRISSYCCCIRK